MKITRESWAVAVPAATLTALALAGGGTWAGALIFVLCLVWIVKRKSVRAIRRHQKIPTTGQIRSERFPIKEAA